MLNHFNNNDKIIIKSQHTLERYLKFIDKYISNPKIKHITECHHILPKIYFPEFEKNKWNKVNLPKRAHYIAHYMLAIAIGGKMWPSFQLMGRIKKHKSRHYEKFKTAAQLYNSDPIKKSKISKTVKTLWDDEEYRLKQEESRPISSGIHNNNIKPITIYNNSNDPILTVLYNLRETLNLLDMPGQAFYTSLYSCKPLFTSNRNSDIVKYEKRGYAMYKGWYALHAKK